MRETDDEGPLPDLAAQLEEVARRIAGGAGGAELRDLAAEAVALASRIGEALPSALRDDDG